MSFFLSRGFPRNALTPSCSFVFMPSQICPARCQSCEANCISSIMEQIHLEGKTSIILDSDWLVPLSFPLNEWGLLSALLPESLRHRSCCNLLVACSWYRIRAEGFPRWRGTTILSYWSSRHGITSCITIMWPDALNAVQSSPFELRDESYTERLLNSHIRLLWPNYTTASKKYEDKFLKNCYFFSLAHPGSAPRSFFFRIKAKRF